MNKYSVKGFTLIELMIVVAVVALLASVALPAYTSQMEKSRRAEGQALLLEVMNAQEKYRNVNYTYTNDLTDLGYAASTVASDNGFYTVSAAACNSDITSCIELTADAGTAQNDDGDLTLDSIGRKERVLPDTSVEEW